MGNSFVRLSIKVIMYVDKEENLCLYGEIKMINVKTKNGKYLLLITMPLYIRLYYSSYHYSQLL